MKTGLTTISVSLFTALTLFPTDSGLSQTKSITKQESVHDTRTQINQATGLLDEFKQTKSVITLEKAVRSVEKIPRPGTDKAIPQSTARQELAKVWFGLLATIDQNIDESLDVNDPMKWPPLHPIPEGPEGSKYHSGVYPKDIKEPAVRAQYEAALKKNHEKRMQLNFQIDLRNIRDHVVFDVESFVRTYFTSSKEDQTELGNLIRETKLSQDRAKQLKTVLHKS